MSWRKSAGLANTSRSATLISSIANGESLILLGLLIRGTWFTGLDVFDNMPGLFHPRLELRQQRAGEGHKLARKPRQLAGPVKPFFQHHLERQILYPRHQ